MRILAVSDEPCEYLWGPMVRDALKDIDMILSCGDLPPEYLEYLVSFTAAPLIYVHGNHDGRHGRLDPGGCICADGSVVTVKGVRIAGLGGSVRYTPNDKYQYTQRQMKLRAAKLIPAIKRQKGVDILLTHSGAFGVGDRDDNAHVGFEAFNVLLDRLEPPFFVHGHTHLSYTPAGKRELQYKNTRVINAYQRVIFEL